MINDQNPSSNSVEDSEFLADCPNLFLITEGPGTTGALGTDALFLGSTLVNQWFESHRQGAANLFYIDPMPSCNSADQKSRVLREYKSMRIPEYDRNECRKYNAEINLQKFLFIPAEK